MRLSVGFFELISSVSSFIHSSIESPIDAFIRHCSSQALNTVSPFIWFAEVINGRGDLAYIVLTGCYEKQKEESYYM